MSRRVFLGGAAAAAAAAVAGCARAPEGPAGADRSGETFRWRMVTTWPANFPGLGTGANLLADLVDRCSAGRLKIRVYGAGELVPAFEVFDAVSRGTAELGHGASYYWKGKTEAASVFTAIPFGMVSAEMNAWLYFGGGLQLWEETYAPFGILPVPCGNSSCQMGGWFNREIRRIEDLRGLRMRIPGFGGEVLQRAGGVAVTLPGGEIFTALQTGTIDAAEWIGPWNDLAFGLHRAAKYYYYPGWQEPGSTLECLVNRRAYDSLPEDLQQILLACCRAVNDTMLAEFTARSFEALQQLVEVHKVQVRPFPPEVLRRLRELSQQVLDATAARDPQFRKVLASATQFQRGVSQWTRIGDQALLNARDL
jgi:TRAP-type mannitol/chloroaromatic compound transport system substrate-binding protein